MNSLKNVKGFLAVLLAVAMIAAMVACGDNSSTEQSNTSTASSASTSSTKNEAPANEPITLSILMGEAPGLQDGINDVPLFKEITKATGITLDVVTTNKDKFKVQAAGGDLPDIIELQESQEMAPTLISSGAVIPLDDLLNTHGQNILKNIPLALKWEKEIVGNGKIYFLPVATSRADLNNAKPNSFVGFFTRWDVYKAIGAPEMKNEDDFLEVCKKMQEYQPKTKDGKKVYALSAWTDWGLWPYTISYPFSYGFSNKSDYASLNRETGELESNFLKEDGVFWRGIAFMNKAYRMGVFDPEGLTMKYDQYMKKVASGEVLNSAANFIPVDTKLTNELATMVVIPGAFPYITDVYTSDKPLGYSNTDARAITSNCKYPERAMQLLNYFDSTEGARLIMNGIKGTDWDVVDGKPTLIGEHMKAVKDGTSADYYSKTQIRTFNLYYTGSVVPEDGYPVDLQNAPEIAIDAATPGYKDFAKYFDPSFSYPGQVYAKAVKEGKAKTITSANLGSSLAPAPSDSTTQTLNKGSQYVISNVAKLIMAKDDEKFVTEKKKIIDDIKAMGYEKAFDDLLALYEEGKATEKRFNK